MPRWKMTCLHEEIGDSCMQATRWLAFEAKNLKVVVRWHLWQEYGFGQSSWSLFVIMTFLQNKKTKLWQCQNFFNWHCSLLTFCLAFARLVTGIQLVGEQFKKPCESVMQHIVAPNYSFFLALPVVRANPTFLLLPNSRLVDTLLMWEDRHC